MASKIPPPSSSVTKDSGRAAALAKALDEKKKDAPKKSTIDPLRDPSTYTQDELNAMMNEGEVPSNFTQDNLVKFVVGEITWAELTGLTMQEAYSFAEIAYNLFEQGKYDQAQTIVEGLVISNPYDGYFHGLLGAIYGRKGMHEEAQEEYTIAVDLDPTNISAFVNRAEILLQHGDIEKALKDLKKAIELDPKGEKPFGVRARALAAATASVLEEALKQSGIDIEKTAAQQAKKPAAGKPAPAPAKKK
ncbi:MAG TPA: tetratricopeptide repeat protein [Myxococcota bacterium]